MKISTQEDYDKIPDGTVLKVFLEGDGWDEDCGEVIDVIKFGNKLHDTPTTYWNFEERDEEEYQFSVVKPVKRY